jgi:hypothetical protein
VPKPQSLETVLQALLQAGALASRPARENVVGSIEEVLVIDKRSAEKP